jgi:hypothetical protein
MGSAFVGSRRPGRVLGNRSGATLPLVTLLLVALLGFAALAIDVGLLVDTRAETQRAADAAALAGASALLEYRALPQATREDYARERALAIAALNTVRGSAPEEAEVGVSFPEDPPRVAVTITRDDIPPLFAGVLGFQELRVSATSHAMVFQGGTATCLKPFAVPDREPYTANSIHDEILVWQKSADGDFPLVKHLIQPNVRTSLESQTCNTQRITVGDILDLQSGGASMAGQVEKGLETLRGLDTSLPELAYDPALYGELGYDGFNRPDWRGHPRVINLITYDPDANVGNTQFLVTGFLTVFLNRHVEVQQGNDLRQYGIILPNRPVGGICTPPNCSATSWGVRLVR